MHTLYLRRKKNHRTLFTFVATVEEGGPILAPVLGDTFEIEGVERILSNGHTVVLAPHKPLGNWRDNSREPKDAPRFLKGYGFKK